MNKTVIEQPTSPFVFLSHAHADEAYVTHLLHDLQAQGIAVWIDRHSLPVGTPDWEEALRTAIIQSAAVVLVASPHARSSQVVRDELDVALLYERPVYPFWVDGQHWIESIPLGWGRIQRLDARQSRYEAAQVELIALLQKRLHLPLAPVSLPPSPNEAHQKHPLWSVPYRRNRLFTGREQDLHALSEQLTVFAQVAVTQAITGLGGIGKTQLAVEYAYALRSTYRAIFWIRAETEETLLSDLAALAVLLNLPEQAEHEQIKVVHAVIRWLSYHSAWLLILDNVEDLQLVETWTPLDHHGAILLTTRHHVTEPVAQAMELNVFSDDDSTLFLLKRAKRLAPDAALAKAPAHELIAARTIAQQLGALPLALDQAGAYIAETRCSLAHYLDLLKQQKADLLQRRGTVSRDHPQSVTTTFTLAFEQIQQKNEAAIELLKLCAFLAPDAIPMEVITQGSDHLGSILASVASDNLQLDRALETLQAYSLVRRDGENRILSIHRIVQAVAQDRLVEAERRTWAERMILAVNAAFPYVEHSTWPQCERLLPQAMAATQAIEQYHFIGEEVGNLLHKAATYLRDRAHYSEAEPLYQRAIVIREQQLGLEHPAVATSANGLANLYRGQGKYAQAEPLYQRAIAIFEQQLGPWHPDVAMSVNGLAILYLDEGRYAMVEPLYQRALVIREQQLGPEHPDVATSLNGLANLYYRQGKYVEAEPLYQRALRIQQQQLGPEHPDVASFLNGLASLYFELEKYVEAEQLFQRASQIWEKQLGPEHPNTVYTLHNLANLYKAQGKYALAEQLFQRSLQLWEQQLGPEHPQVAYPLNDMADLYQAQGKYARAEPLYQRALQIFEQQLGLEHPNVAYPLTGLANLFREQGKYMEAERFYQRALSIRENALGLQHSETAETMYGLARLRDVQDVPEEARDWYTRALVVREQAYGVYHSKTTETRKHLIDLYRAMGQYEVAAPLETIQSAQRTSKEEKQEHQGE